MTVADHGRRRKRLLQTSCLTAGLVLAALVPLPAEVRAQSLDPATGLTDPTVSVSASVTDPAQAPATIAKKKKKKKAQTATDDEPLNARAARLTGSDDAGDATADAIRENARATPLDGIRAIRPPETGETAGIRLGNFILRPSVNTSVDSETTKSAGSSTTRSYLQTDLKGTLTSDWSRHQLTITGDGILQRNISGEGQTEPSASLAADLRLDLSDDTVAHVTAGYTVSRESTTDPNAVLGATAQSAVQGLASGLSIERDFGILRGLAAVDVNRSIYSDVTLSDGSTVSLDDRNRNTGTLRLRAGYELSPALIPFVEASAGRSIYDLTVDSTGYQRDSRSLGGKGGIQFDFGEKLKGELGLGYKRVTFADARLAAIDAMVLDAAASWSPRRGTDVTLGLVTSVEPSVVAGQSGYVNRQLSLELTQQVRDDLVAKFTGAATWRSYRPSGTSADETVTTLGAGLAYGLNRYVDVTGDLAWERTTPDGGDSTDVLRAGLGLTLKR